MIEPWVLVYYRIRQRCNNKNWDGYKNYGGRGIKCLITKEELKKLWFRDKAYELKKPSIDRKNHDKNYEYGNCRFIENSINAAVRRNSTKPNCPQGHPLKGKNLYLNFSQGYRNRICRICTEIGRKKYKLKKQASLAQKEGA